MPLAPPVGVVEVVPEPLAELPEDFVEPLVPEEPPVVPVVVPAGEVAGPVAAVVPELPPAVVVGVLPPLDCEAAPFKQLLSGPAWMVTGADWATAPLLSVSVRPIEVPAEMLVDHVKEVPVTPVYCWKAVAPGTPPGAIAKK